MRFLSLSISARALLIAGALLVAGATRADLPADAAINAAAPLQTMQPKVIVNSGRLEWVPYYRDLTAWPTLSHQDRRSTPRPRKVKLDAPVRGDPARGRDLAMRPDKGYCIACHQLPGEEWPGSVGLSLERYKSYGHADELVFQQIFDARAFNPHSVMPPYGTFGILTVEEIADLVAYLQSLE